MAISNSKPHFVPIQSSFSILLVIFITFFILLPNKVNSSDSLSFTFSNFGSDVKDIIFQGDAHTSSGTLELTKTDANGNPVQGSGGRAPFAAPVHLWEGSTSRVASFYTSFSFVIKPPPTSRSNQADGLTFFIAPPDSVIPDHSGGGYLTIVNGDTDPSLNQIVAVEFDTYVNDWDPPFPHIGIDVNSIQSTTTVKWEDNDVLSGLIANAQISYDGISKILTVVLTYPNGGVKADYILSRAIDLTSILPEWVRVGLSASTGGGVETHTVLYWHFSSNLQSNGISVKMEKSYNMTHSVI